MKFGTLGGALLLLGTSSLALAQEQQTVTFMALDVVNFRGALEEFITEFEAANPDVDIVANFTPQLFDQFLPLLQAGNLSDITFIASPAFLPYLASGRLQPLPTDFVAGLEGVLYPETLGPVSRGDEVFAVPYNYYPSSGIIMYNADLWEKAGIDPTTAATWEDYMELAQAVTIRDDSGRIMQAGYSGQRDPFALFLAWLMQLGGKPFNEDGTAAFNSEEGRVALQYYADIYKTWQIDDYEFSDTIDGFNQGIVAATMVGPWYGSILASNHPEIRLKHMTQPPLPGVAVDQPNYWPLKEVWAHLISAEGAEKDGTWRFIEYLLQPDVSARWAVFSGELPAVIEAASQPQVSAIPYIAPYVDVLEFGVSEGVAEYLSSDVVNVLLTMLESVARDQTTIEGALATAETEVNRLTARMVH